MPRASKRPRVYGDESKFKAALARADVRLQAWLTSNDEMHVELGDDVLLVIEDLPPS